MYTMKNYDMKSYESFCNTDADLQAFDAALRDRTSRAVNSIASGIEHRHFSFDAAKDVISCLLEMENEVLMAFLQNKKNIWKDRELFHHVEDYLKSSIQTLDFCTALEKSLDRFYANLSHLKIALQYFDEEHSGNVEGIKYPRTLEELRKYKEAEVHFAEEFFTMLSSIRLQQESILNKMYKRKRKIDRKLKSTKTWKRISNIIFVSSMVALIICSVVAVAVSAPPVVAAIAAALTAPVTSTGKWFTSMLKKYNDGLWRQGEVVGLMELGTYLTIKDLAGIRVDVECLLIKMESIVAVADMGIGEGEIMKIAVDEMRRNVAVFSEKIVDLGVLADKCNKGVLLARRVVLHKIVSM